MKSLDDQVDGASDGSVPVPDDSGPASPPRPTVAAQTKWRRTTTRVVVVGILGALASGVVDLTIHGVQDNAADNAAIARISPTSIYNTRLSAALKSRATELTPAEETLAQAKYLQSSPDFVNLDWALSDTQSTLELHNIDLVNSVTKHEYESAIADIDSSLSQLAAARSVVLSDMAATPAPATTG